MFTEPEPTIDDAIAEVNNATIAKNEPVAKIKRRGVFIDLYARKTKDGKDGVFAVLKRRYKKGNHWEDTPFINSLRDFDALIEAVVEAKAAFRDFYSDRNNHPGESE